MDKYEKELGANTEHITNIMKMVQSGEKFVHMLYTFRSIAKAVPMMQSGAEDVEEINRTILEIMEPEVAKLRELIFFVDSLIEKMKSCINFCTYRAGTEVNEGVYMAFVAGIDLIVKLDFLKDARSSLTNDFTRYKRTKQLVSVNISTEEKMNLDEELVKLQMFLSNPDPRKAKHYIFLTLRDEIKKIACHEDVLVQILEHSSEYIVKDLHITPDEKHRALRVMPTMMLLIDGEPDNPKQSVFKHKALTNLIPTLQQIFKRHPVVPLYADITITVMYIFERSPNFNGEEMGSSWGADEKEKIEREHSVKMHWAGIKQCFNLYSNMLLVLKHDLVRNPFTKQVDERQIEKSKEVYLLVKEGLNYISNWNGVVSRAMAWKLTHPCSAAHLEAVGADLSFPGIEYERLIKYNFTNAELNMFVDIITIIKSLTALLDQCKALLAPFIRFHIHHQIQQLVQGNMLPILHRMDKRGSKNFPSLLRLRTLNADWINDQEQCDDYKGYSRKMGSIQSNHPARVVGPGYIQLQLLRSELRTLYDEKSAARKTNSFFGKADLEKDDIEAFESFYYESIFYPYLLDFTATLKDISDMSYLWFRELYLEATRCVQFPIDMSLPWLLTEHIIKNQAGILPVIENVFYTLDIYNDAAYTALYVLGRQFLYDEIEAETNLVFDQFATALAEEVFSHYKNLAAYTRLDKDAKEAIKKLKFSKRRYEIPISQRHVRLLGRTINLNNLIAKHVNNWLVQDIGLAFDRLEASSAVGLIEFSILLGVIRETHTQLSKWLSLDPFDTMFNESNCSCDPTQVRSLLSTHIVKCLSR